MFEFRFSSFLKALLLLACIIGGGGYLVKLDKLKAELAELKSLADTARETADLRHQEWTEIKTAKDKLDQLESRMTEVNRQRDLLDTKERKLTGGYNFQFWESRWDHHLVQISAAHEKLMKTLTCLRAFCQRQSHAALRIRVNQQHAPATPRQ